MPPFAAQALYSPLMPWLSALPGDGGPPGIGLLNRLAAERGITSGGGVPLSFVVPGGCGLSYEERIYWLGQVDTRSGNWHDGFNALVWLAYPRTKAALNARHHRALQSATGNAGRGPLRDALTQFDECGVAVASASLELWQGIRSHRWKEVFWSRRAEVLESLRVFVFGHASYDLLRSPYLGLCGKATFFHVEPDWLARPPAEQIDDIDRSMAQRFAGDFCARPRDFQPLPLLGIPGVTADNEFPAYYDDTRQFRPLRLLQSSSEVR